MSKPIDELKTAADFREFFAEIPDEKWTTGDFVDADGCMCAAGHLGMRRPEWEQEKSKDPTNRLGHIIGFNIALINDGDDRRYQQPTPKARILAALDHAISKGL